MVIILHFIFICTAFFFFFGFTNGDIQEILPRNLLNYRTIYVDQSKKIQAAIDSVPSNNRNWVIISVKAGVYNEQVTIPPDKPFIYLKGEGIGKTSIVWGAHDTMFVATFASLADNIFVSGITFVKCRITVNSVTPEIPGFIAAQARGQPNEANGFVFKQCSVNGQGKAFLGRAWKAYSRVIYYESFLSNVVITFSEHGCLGSGSDKSNRVKWEKNLTPAELQPFITNSYIDSDGWIGRLPLSILD
ncbi:hypothetical protein ACJIZ3_017178 [Penstemon smallii]|uniref:pectinesterase n=1 Tax=Penstemon smallii TaxID=265156 RepID=A0ABD3SVF1_9LAMI